MSDGLTTQLKATFDGSEASQGFAKLGVDAERVGKKVKDAGDASAKGLQRIKDAATAAADGMNDKEKRMAANLQNLAAQMAAAGDAAKKFEAKLAFRGMDVEKFRPMIEGLREIQAEQDKATESSKRLSESSRQMASSLGALAAGFMTGAFMHKFISETVNAEQEQAQLAAVLKSTGEAAGWTQQKLNDMAEAMSSKGGKSVLSAGEINQAQTRMLSYSNVVGEVFPRAMQGAVDMSQRMGVSVTQAAESIGKALDVPSEGLSALSKQGFRFTEQQKLMVEQLEATGQAGKAQAIILEAVEASYGGAAEAARNTLGGSLKALQNQFNDLMTGDAGSANGLRNGIEDLTKTMASESTKAGFQAVLSGITSVINLALTGISVLGRFATAVSDSSKASDHQTQSKNFDFNKRQYGLMQDLLKADPGNKNYQTQADNYYKAMRDAHAAMQGLTAGMSGTSIPVVDPVKVEASTAAINNQTVALGKSSEWIKAYGTQAEKLNLELTEWRKKLGGAFTPEMEAAIRSSYAAKSQGAKDAASAAKEEAKQYLSLTTSVNEKIALINAEIAGNQKLTESEKFAVKLASDLAGGKIKLTAAHEAELKALMGTWAGREKDLELRQNELAAMEQDRVIRMALIGDMEKSAQSYADGNKALEEEIEMIGKSVDERAKILKSRNDELILIKKVTLAEMQRRSAETGTQTRAEIALAYEIEQLERRNELLTQKGVVEEADKVQQQLREQFSQTVQQVEDVFVRGFADMMNNGKSGWDSFCKSLKTSFYTLVAKELYAAFAKPFVVQLVGSFMGMTGGNGLMGVLGGGGGSGSNLLSTGSNLYSAYNTGSSLYAVGSQYFAGTMSAANAGGTLFANSVGGGLDALLATNGAYGTAGGASLGAMSGAGIGAAIVMAAAYLGGMFKSEKQVGAGITGELGGDLYGYQLMREGGSLFSGPSYRYIVAQKELEKARAEIEELKQNPNLETDGNLTYRMKYLRERVEMLQGKYGSSIEASKGPVDVLQQSYSAIRESVATQADSLGLDGDAVRKMKTALGLDEIHPDTGGLGIELSGLTEEEATAKVKAALEKANEDLARSVLGSMQEVTREVTRTYADSTTIQDADGNVYENRVWHDVTETVTTMEWVMSEYVREGETAVAALNRISGSLVGVNNVFELLGADLLSASVASGDWASKLIDSMGGIDNLNAAAGGYYDRYYSDDEKRARQISTANSGMEELGFGLRAGDDNAMQKYRDLVDGAIAAKDEVLLASLLKFAEQFGLGVDAVVSATQVHLDELKKAQEAAEELKQKALAATGLSVDSMVSGFMEQVNSGRGAQAGVWLADTIAVGFEQAIYGQALSVIMNSIIDGVITPVVTAAMTGSTVSAAISGAAIDTMVANATAAATALATLMNDPAFKEAMAKTLEIIKDLGNSIGTTIPKMSTYKPTLEGVSNAYGNATSAAESAADAAKRVADQWKSTVELMSDEMKRLRGELLGESDDQGMAYYEGLFAIKTAQARAGDQDAADELPSIIQALEALAKGSAGSKSEVLLMQSAWLDSLGYTRDFLASKYGVDIGNEQSSVTGATAAATVIRGTANTAVLGALQSSSDSPALLAVLQSIDARLDRVEKDQRSLGEAQLVPLQDIASSNKRMQKLQEMEGT